MQIVVLISCLSIVWLSTVNKTLEYGTCAARKVTGHHLCHHPSTGGNWLRRHGLRESKAGCIEINNADDYLRTRHNWGKGGLLLHELSHAYHDLGCNGGYDCTVVDEVITIHVDSTRIYD